MRKKTRTRLVVILTILGVFGLIFSLVSGGIITKIFPPKVSAPVVSEVAGATRHISLPEPVKSTIDDIIKILERIGAFAVIIVPILVNLDRNRRENLAFLRDQAAKNAAQAAAPQATIVQQPAEPAKKPARRTVKKPAKKPRK